MKTKTLKNTIITK